MLSVSGGDHGKFMVGFWNQSVPDPRFTNLGPVHMGHDSAQEGLLLRPPFAIVLVVQHAELTDEVIVWRWIIKQTSGDQEKPGKLL